MNEWYYTKDSAQLGPVSETELKSQFANGTLDPSTTLVWKSGMGDWLPAAQISELTSAPPSPAAGVYAPPASGFNVAETPIGLPEIDPGSESIDAMACMKRGFDLTFRNIGTVILAMVVYAVFLIGLTGLLMIMDTAMGWGGPPEVIDLGNGQTFTMRGSSSVLNQIISNVLSIFLSLGLARFALNIVSGRDASVGQLFGEGRHLLTALVASILFGLMMIVGFVLLIVPGFYVIARFGFYVNAIVDRNCGIIESLKYSSRITTNNRMNLILIMLLSFVAVLLGCLALCLGIFIAYPVILLAWAVAYRWLQYGYRAAMDHPGTKQPMLAPHVG